jgi:hypothetical protein
MFFCDEIRIKILYGETLPNFFSMLFNFFLEDRPDQLQNAADQYHQRTLILSGSPCNLFASVLKLVNSREAQNSLEFGDGNGLFVARLLQKKSVFDQNFLMKKTASSQKTHHHMDLDRYNLERFSSSKEICSCMLIFSGILERFTSHDIHSLFATASQMCFKVTLAIYETGCRGTGTYSQTRGDAVYDHNYLDIAKQYPLRIFSYKESAVSGNPDCVDVVLILDNFLRRADVKES